MTQSFPLSNDVAKEEARRRTLLDISQEIIALHDARQDAEDDGDAARVAAIDRDLQVYLRAELAHKVDSVRNFIREQEHAAELYKAEAATLALKAKRAAETVERVKGFVLGIMQALNIPKYQGATHWIRKQANGGIKPLEIVQPDLVPDRFKLFTICLTHSQYSTLCDLLRSQKIPVPPCIAEAEREPDNQAIRAALERGEGVPGCRLLERGEHLRYD